jgi:acyl-CoA synthetase (AMP-forming)/AMP-acid ligase II
MACHRSGATVVVMERFDAEQALRLIETRRVTHSQWVPTMFVRLLKLPEAARTGYDLSSLRWAVHAAEPVPGPGPGQAGHDRVVGADPLRVLLDDRGIRGRVDLFR